MRIRRPIAVLGIMLVSFTQVLLCMIVTAVVFAALWKPSAGTLAEVRKGFIEGLGADPETYGAYQVGYLSTKMAIAAVCPVLILVFLGSGRMWAIRITALIQVLQGLSPPGLPLVLAIVVAVLAFLPSTRKYCHRIRQPASQGGSSPH